VLVITYQSIRRHNVSLLTEAPPVQSLAASRGHAGHITHFTTCFANELMKFRSAFQVNNTRQSKLHEYNIDMPLHGVRHGASTAMSVSTLRRVYIGRLYNNALDNKNKIRHN
jgi:hypothetical protein